MILNNSKYSFIMVSIISQVKTESLTLLCLMYGRDLCGNAEDRIRRRGVVQLQRRDTYYK